MAGKKEAKRKPERVCYCEDVYGGLGIIIDSGCPIHGDKAEKANKGGGKK